MRTVSLKMHNTHNERRNTYAYIVFTCGGLEWPLNPFRMRSEGIGLEPVFTPRKSWPISWESARRPFTPGLRKGV